MLRSKLFRSVLMAALLCATSATFAASASAWTTNAVPFTATAPTAKFTINSTPAVAGTCSTVSMSGKLAALNGSANAWLNDTTLGGTPVTLSFSNCSFGFVTSIVCTATVRLQGLGYVLPVTTMDIRNVSCAATLPPFPGCTITFNGTGPTARAWGATYDNNLDRLTINSAGQTLTAAWTSACTLFAVRPGTAPATYTTTVNTSLIYTVTSSPQPFITNP